MWWTLGAIRRWRSAEDVLFRGWWGWEADGLFKAQAAKAADAERGRATWRDVGDLPIYISVSGGCRKRRPKKTRPFYDPTS